VFYLLTLVLKTRHEPYTTTLAVIKMNILKALLLIVLLLTFEVIISVGIHGLTQKNIPPEYSIHYFGLMYLIPKIIAYLIVFKIFKVNFYWKNTQNKLRTVELNILFYLLILTIGLELLGRPFLDFSKIVDFIKDVPVEPYAKSEKLNISIIYKGISALIIAPIFEELLFRKYMYTELLKKYSSNLSIVISSIFFSLIHLPNYKNLIPSFIFGIVCCLVYRKTKNISYTIILHFLTNLSVLILVNYRESLYEWSFGLENNLIYWILFGIGIILTLFGIKKITTANTV
jgi:membrane protease YdiL (CAAX protease family)